MMVPLQERPRTTGSHTWRRLTGRRGDGSILVRQRSRASGAFLGEATRARTGSRRAPAAPTARRAARPPACRRAAACGFRGPGRPARPPSGSPSRCRLARRTSPGRWRTVPLPRPGPRRRRSVWTIVPGARPRPRRKAAGRRLCRGLNRRCTRRSVRSRRGPCDVCASAPSAGFDGGPGDAPIPFDPAGSGWRLHCGSAIIPK